MPEKSKVSGIMYIRLASYLQRLRAVEKHKPAEQRLSVPTMKELSQAAGVNPSRISRMVQGHTRSFNLDIAAAIMTEMWQRGFQTEVGDLLTFEPPPNLVPQKSEALDPWSPPPPPLTRRQRLKYPGEEFVKAYEEDSPSEP